MRASGIIAVAFDFDETVSPDSTTKFLASRGVDATEFWTETRRRAEDGWDPTLAWLNLFLERSGSGRELGTVSNADLREFGASLDEDIYPGFTEMISDLRSTVAQYRDMKIEFYVVSGGLRVMIEGSDVVHSTFEAVYGCEFAEREGEIAGVKRCINFTEKTRYLFEINKGIPQDQADRSPYLVNRAVPLDDRRVPFANMIYIGDGLTDIPCFSLLQKNDGVAFGVFDASKEGHAKRALTEFLQPGRVLGMYAPRYRTDDDLGALIRATVATMCSRIEINSRQAYGG